MIDIVYYNDINKIEFKNQLLSRSQLDYSGVFDIVSQIVVDVQKNGDESLFHYTNKFDCPLINENNVLVTEGEIKEAYKEVSKELIEIIKKSIKRVEDYHKKQLRNSWMSAEETGEILGQIIRPVESAGVYVPGGKAAYPSSVIMNVIPARVAGVEKIYMVTPPNKEGKINSTTIVTAHLTGIKDIYKIGGAQGIAALAFGTKSVPKVDKIVGPGNIYVALAKKQVFGYVSIDSVAGPSEILIIADESANPKFVAADLLSQSEHDELASSILLTTSKELAIKTKEEIISQTNRLERKDIIEKSLKDYGKIIVCENMDSAIELSNLVAPEHLEICTNAPFDVLPKIKNAGAIFLGHYTPEPLGDYMAGPNHVLPTSGTAKFFSPLNVDDFTKKSSVLSFTKEAMENLSKDVIAFANAEGLTAHANSIEVRINE